MQWSLDEWYSPVTGLPVTDMSAAGKSVTEWFPSGKIGDMTSMTAVWPATGAPVGVLSIEQTNEPAPVATTTPDYLDLTDYYSASFPEPNPVGTAGRKPVLVPFAGSSMRWAYDRTSGGTGAVCTVYCAGGNR